MVLSTSNPLTSFAIITPTLFHFVPGLHLPLSFSLSETLLISYRRRSSTMMKSQEEVMGCKDLTQIIKGKRTKRQRLPSPLRLAMASSSSSDGGEASATTSAEFIESREEEEDMANCLILLARGGHGRKASEPVASASNKAAGLYAYECKTCNRCFPSFQALGGHRASHKKPKANTEEKIKAVAFVDDQEQVLDQFNNTSTSTTLSLQIANRVIYSSNNKSKVHECSICGAEFSSGQALGGHMRRHRTFVSTTTTSADHQSQEAKKQRNILQLDLNLPAPEDDHHHRESKFPFVSKEQVLVFSASPLVDCHY